MAKPKALTNYPRPNMGNDQKTCASDQLLHWVLKTDLTGRYGVCLLDEVHGGLVDWSPGENGCPSNKVSKDCARCRHFITGIPFLGGMLTRCNVLLDKVQAAQERIRALESNIAILVTKVSDQSLAAHLARNTHLDLLRKQLKRDHEELHEVACKWDATHALINHLTEIEFGHKTQN